MSIRGLFFSAGESPSPPLANLVGNSSTIELTQVRELEELSEALQQQKYDVILLDPGSDNLTITEHIHKLNHAKIPILTPYPEDDFDGYQMVLNSTTDWLEWRGVSGEYRFISSAVQKLTGYTQAEFLQDPNLLERIVHPEDQEFVRNHHATIHNQDAPRCKFDFRINHREGGIRWIRHECNPVTASGKWLGRFAYNWDVTREKAFTEKSINADQIIDALIEAPIDGVLIIEPDGKIITANRIQAQGFGTTIDKIIGKNTFEFFPEPLAQFRRKLVQQVVETGQPFRFQGQGREGFVDATLYPILDEHKRVELILILTRDISEQKRAEEDLSRSFQTIKALFSSPSDVACVIDLDGKIVLANDSLARSLDTDSEKLIGEILWKYFTPEKAKFRQQILEQVRQTRKAVRVDDQGVRGYYDAIIHPIFNHQGEVEQVAILARDISDRIKSEEALREREAMLQLVMEHAPIVLISIDAHGLIRFAKGKALEHFFIPSEKLIGTSIFEIDHKHVPREITESFRMALEGKENQFAIHNINDQFFHLNISMITGSDGACTGCVGVITEITEMVRIQAELENAQMDLEKKIEQRTQALNQANLELQQRIVEQARVAAEAEALSRVTAKINLLSDQPSILQTVAEETLRAIDYQFCSITIYDEELDALLLAALSPAMALPFPSTPAPRLVFEKFLKKYGSPIVMADIREEPDLPDYELMKTLNIRTGISVPMTHEGVLIGFVNVASVDQIRLPEKSELKLLKVFADQATIGITKARLFDQVSESRERLRALSARLVEVQEMDRRNLAKELHDEIGQSLTLLRLNLDLISRGIQPELEANEDIYTQLKNAQETTIRLLERVRELSLNLRPNMLDDLGLVPALLSLFDRFGSQSNLHIRFKHYGIERRFSPNLEITIYRIIQEALTNVVRHARSGNVSIRLWANAYFIRLQVEDQGIGFNVPKVLQSSPTSGLSGMIERAASCGGTLDIESNPNEGTCISAEFPLYIFEETKR